MRLWTVTTTKTRVLVVAAVVEMDLSVINPMMSFLFQTEVFPDVAAAAAGADLMLQRVAKESPDSAVADDEDAAEAPLAQIQQAEVERVVSRNLVLTRNLLLVESCVPPIPKRLQKAACFRAPTD